MESKTGTNIAVRSILLIDDDQVVLESVSNILERAGYKVFRACNGKSGLEMFKKGRFPLVITDLIMDGVDGIGVIKQVKQIRPETKVIAITGCGRIPPTVEAMTEGADEYLLKPCGRDELMQKVAACFDQLEKG